MIYIAYFFSILTVLGSVFKIYMIYDTEKDPFGGGGAPTMDFVLFYPVMLAVFGSIIFKHHSIYPFRFFGLLMYAALLALNPLIYYAIILIVRARAGKKD